LVQILEAKSVSEDLPKRIVDPLDDPTHHRVPVIGSIIKDETPFGPMEVILGPPN
jgi:hypothetical protein